MIGMQYRKAAQRIHSLGILYNLLHFKNRKIPATTSKSLSKAEGLRVYIS
jgi:hypothetical protein